MACRQETDAEPETRALVGIEVPGQRERLVPPSSARVRALKRHLIEAIRDLVGARRPERLIQKRGAEPEPALGAVLAGVCGHCGGSCCMAGGTHAFIDDRTLARVRAERPAMGARAMIGAYVRSMAPLAYDGSCVFHGPAGCTLERGLRAELCNAYYCNGLQEVMRTGLRPAQGVIVRTHAGEEAILRMR